VWVRVAEALGKVLLLRVVAAPAAGQEVC